MSKERKMEMVGRVVSFAEAEELDVAYYASVSWKESVATVEKMRRDIWQDAYENYNEVERVINKRALTDDENEFE